MIPYEILIRGNAEGQFQGAHVIDAPSADARAVTAADINALAPDINAAALVFAQANDAVIADLNAKIVVLETLKKTMIQKVTDALQSGDPAQFQAIALDFITPEEEKIRAEKLAQLESLKAELGVS